MSDHQNSSHENGSVSHGNISIEGTAARTRPFSLEDALLRRKNKLTGSDLKDSSSDPNVTAEKKDSDRTFDLANLPHKYEKDIGNIKSVITSKKDTALSEKDEELLKNKGKLKSCNESEGDAGVKALKSIAKQLSRDNNVSSTHHRSRSKDKLKAEPEKEATKKHAKGAFEVNKQDGKHKIEERYKNETERGAAKKRSKYPAEDIDYDRCRKDELKSDLGRESIKKRFKLEDSKDKDDRRGRIKDQISDELVKENIKKRNKDISSKEKDDHRVKDNHRIRDDDRYRGKYDVEDVKQRSKFSVMKDRDILRHRSPPRDDRRLLHGPNAKFKSEFDRSSFRRYDSRRVEHEDYPDRKYRRHEETTTRRRRSRSRSPDYGRERSVSVSPQNRRRYREGKDYPETSYLNPKVGSTRKHIEVDKYRTSGNAGYEGGHYQNHSSGLGGYSPRKRKTEAKTDSPSPIIHSPERKTMVDLPTAGSVVDSQPTADNAPDRPPSIAVTSSIKKAQTILSPIHATTAFETSTDHVQLTQATRPKRRLYIENLPSSISDKDVIGWLNGVLLSSGANRIPGSSPCISCIINKERSQAVVEFLTPEDATAALAFDGRSFSGSILKIRRPKDFTDTTTTILEKPVAVKQTIVTEASHFVSDIVENSPNKIFVGGISKLLSAEMFMEIANAFGMLKAYRLEINEFEEPCAFLEYVDPSITPNACCGLNGMKLGGHVLTAVLAFPDSLSKQELDTSPAYTIPDHAKSLLQDPTKVLKLKYVFNPEDLMLLSESELEETVEDVRIECSRFGTVKSINIVKENSRSDGKTVSFEQSPKVEREEMVNKKETLESEPIPCENGEAASRFSPAFDNASADNNDEQNADSKRKDAPLFIDEDDANNNARTDLDASDPSPPAFGNTIPGGEAVFELECGQELKEGDTKTETQGLPNDSQQMAVVKSEPDQDDSAVHQKLDEHKLEDVKPEVHNGEAEQSLNDGRDSQTMDMQKEEDIKPEMDDSELEANLGDESDKKILVVDSEVDSKPGSNLCGPEPLLNNEQTGYAEIKQEQHSDGEMVDSQSIPEPTEDDRQPQTHITDLFEIGCVLVEFLREEAACNAAHSLNSRLYDNRAVEASYIPHSCYLARFTR